MGLPESLRSQSGLILDGAMGTELETRGFPGGSLNNLTNPAAVIQVHRDYLAAGCQAIITNTLTMNRIHIESHRLDINVGAVNQAGAKDFCLQDSKSPNPYLDSRFEIRDSKF